MFIKKIIAFLLVSLLIISTSSFILAQSTDEILEPAEDVFSSALEDYNQKNYNQAAEKLNNLLKRNDLTEELEFSALYYSTLTAVKRYQTNQAIKHLEAFNQAGFQDAELNWKIGELFLNKDGQFDSANFEKALVYLNKAEELGLDKLSFKRDLAYAYLENQDLKRSENIYNEIVKENAISSDYFNLARIKEKQEQLNQAVEYYETARDMDGQQSALYLNLGNLYQKLENYDSAVNVYKEGTDIRSEFAALYIGLGESYIRLENYSEAKKALEKAVEINENSYYGYHLLGDIEKENGNHNQAFNYYDQSLKNNPDYVKTYLAQGQLHLEREEYQNAIAKFSTAVEKNPDYAESHYYLGRAYYKADMLEAAAAEFRKTVHINDRFPEAEEMLKKIENELNSN
ncbi:tetratricopeptide repeat protein [Halanaerobium saccharolyticum]|uniref:tetratricopeptide repeat protein n=1 Tax=Halanaerobium saccharolyticum TaxID=43595 RepID=UPI003FCDE64D